MIYTKKDVSILYYRRKIDTTNVLFAKSARTTLWNLLTDFYFETLEGIGFLYLCRNNIPNFRS